MTSRSLNMHTNEEMVRSSTTSFSSSSTNSLVSRLDHLDSMTRYFEPKKHSSRWGSGSEVGLSQKEFVPLDLAVKEAQSRGSLLERIASLEDRLVKLCLLIESKAASPSISSEIEQTFPNTISRGDSRKVSPYSLSCLRPSADKGDKETSQICMDKFPVTEQDDQESTNNNQGHVIEKSKKGISKKASSKAKREGPSSWLHLKLLGC